VASQPNAPEGHNAARLRAARWATRGQFLLFGFVSGVWGVHIPSVKAHYGLDASALSVALWALAVGAVLCLTVAGRIVSRLGAQAAAVSAGLLMCAALAVVLVPTGFAALIGLVLVLGSALALFDVAINAEASVLEAESGKKVMSGFHGMFSLGGMAGAALAALLIQAGVPAALQLVTAAAVAAALGAGASNFMLPVPVGAATPGPGRGVPRGALATLGLLAAVGLLAEAAIYDWSVLYLQEEVGAVPALAALGFATFSAAMAVTRFAGDRLRTRFSAARLLTGSALLAAVAMATVLLARQPLIALVGLALVGVGLANVVPILFIAASRVPGTTPAHAIAAVSSVGYLGMVAGPPLVGGIAQASSLTWGLGVVVAGALVLAWGARRIPQ
jgi:fucose permease